MNKEYNELVLAEEEFGEDLWHTVGEAIKILCKANYECEVYEDERDIVVIRFNICSKLHYGNNTIEWVSPEEIEMLYQMREDTKEPEPEVIKW